MDTKNYAWNLSLGHHANKICSLAREKVFSPLKGRLVSEFSPYRINFGPQNPQMNDFAKFSVGRSVSRYQCNTPLKNMLYVVGRRMPIQKLSILSSELLRRVDLCLCGHLEKSQGN